MEPIQPNFHNGVRAAHLGVAVRLDPELYAFPTLLHPWETNTFTKSLSALPTQVAISP